MSGKEKIDAFADLHPAICMLFYITTIFMGMFFVHPVFLSVSLIMSLSYHIMQKKGKSMKLIVILIPVFVALSVINPFFNTNGSTILFTYFDRPYFLEALYYGMSTALMFISIMVWFSTYNEVMTSDKFLYLFGKLVPSLSLILTMVLRLVPNFHRKTLQIVSARKCIGMNHDSGSPKMKVQEALSVVSSLTGWALEGGLNSTDSMRARGYGCGTRTHFSRYYFKNHDMVMMIGMVLLMVVCLVCASLGGMDVIYVPAYQMASMRSTVTQVGIIAYTLLLSIPFVWNIREEIIWYILKSKI